MTFADKVTSIRVVLSPVFFVVYLFPKMIPSWAGYSSRWTVPVLWLFFIVSEISDLLDGRIARSRGEVGDFGKLYDPFADVLVRVTYFLCFVLTDILPAILFLLVLYREFGILFIRTLMMKKGIALGARKGGKLKAVTYMLTGVAALLAASVERLDLDKTYFTIFSRSAIVIFLISVIISLLSFIDYVLVYKSAGEKSQ